MRHVTTRSALTDLNRFLREMYMWCDQNGWYDTGVVSVSRGSVNAMRRIVDSVVMADGGDVVLPDGYDSAYAYLADSKSKRPTEKEAARWLAHMRSSKRSSCTEGT